MNKTKKSALGAAGVGVVALAMLGGGTFAAWSDFQTVDDNRTDAGHLVLRLDGSGPISNVGATAIAPGEFRTIDFFVASADLDGVPNASLSFTLKNLVDAENLCSSDSEAAVDNCAGEDDRGEFSRQSYVRVRYSDPTSSAVYQNNQCPGTALTNGDMGNNDTTLFESMADLRNAKYDLGDLAAGEGVCVRFDIGLPPTADNKSQGDSASFDLQWDLEQNV